MQDIKNSEEYKNLWTRANYDDLTKVLNRRAGRERLISLFEKARTESRMLVVSLCDVNDLKQINDRYGHREGDNMLQYVAQAMSRELKEKDILFRLSGDEFVMAFYDENENNAEKRMQRILAYLKEIKNSRKVVYETSFSYGLVEIYPEEYFLKKRTAECIFKRGIIIYCVRSRGWSSRKILESGSFYMIRSIFMMHLWKVQMIIYLLET